jgi:NitT/TauT family transport system substrate-binding protein
MRHPHDHRRGLFTTLTISALVAVVVAGSSVSATSPPSDTSPATDAPADTALTTEPTATEPDQDAELTTVRVAFTPGFGTLPVRIASELGYFEANGLDVEFTEGLDLAAWTGALDRQFDIVMNLPSGTLQAASQEVPLTVISGMQITDPEHPNNVLVTNDPEIESPADLGGRTVGVPTLTGSSAEAVLYVAMEAGVDIDDINLVQTPFDTMGDQLEAGRIDAAVSAIPFYTAQEAAGLIVLDDVIIEAVETATDGASSRASTALFISSPSYAQDNPEVIEAWRQSLQQGVDLVESNEAEAREILQAWLNLPPQIAQDAPLPGLDVEITVDDIEPFAVIGEALGSLETGPDVSELVYEG